MPALRDKDDIMTFATFMEPLSKDTFASTNFRRNPVSIHAGSVINGSSHIQKSIKNSESIFSLPSDTGIDAAHSHWRKFKIGVWNCYFLHNMSLSCYVIEKESVLLWYT